MCSFSLAAFKIFFFVFQKFDYDMPRSDFLAWGFLNFVGFVGLSLKFGIFSYIIQKKCFTITHKLLVIDA
jgi:hypothetical protein